MPRIEHGLNEKTGLAGEANRIAQARADIDNETSAAILAGFDYEVQGELLHFSYDQFDQQNFADTANACILVQTGTPGLPDSVTWNAYRKNGEMVQLTLSSADFLALYVGGALAHKSRVMAEGGTKKAGLA